MVLDQRNLVTEHVGRQESRTHEFQAMNCNVRSHQGQKKFIWGCLSKKRFDAGYKKLGAGALGSRGMVWGGRWEGVQDGEHVYTCSRCMLMYG